MRPNRPDPAPGAEVTPAGRGPLTWVLTAAAVLVIAAVVAFAVLGEDEQPVGGVDEVVEPDQATTTTRLVVPAAGGATGGGRCMVPDPEVLAGAPTAFAGRVVELRDGQAVLVPTERYAGRVTDRVEVAAPDGETAVLLDAVPFEEGLDYLVAADQGEVMVCGYSGEVDAERQQLYDDAFDR